MPEPDLNLLRALDALLAEESVTGAARRLGLSASAMSRTLARLRRATGDKLLVRAGGRLVPTPRAVALGERVRAVLHEAASVLAPADPQLDVLTLQQTFTVRASESFLDMLSAPVAAVFGRSAPLACLRFVPKPDRDPRPLREGTADLEIGLLEDQAPELRVRLLFNDRLVGVAREGHPLLSAPTAARFAACDHVVAAKETRASLSVDAALAQAGLRRAIRVVVPGYPDAMRIVRASDLIGVVPLSCLGNRLMSSPPGLAAFDLPVALPPFRVAAMWHPRLDADPAQRWLRRLIHEVCREAYAQRDA